MRILFIATDSGMHERLGVMALGAALKRDGHQVRFILTRRTPPKELDALMTEYAPQIVGYSVSTGEHLELIPLNAGLKKQFKFISVFGGPHATCCPPLIEEEGIDATCAGEGDIAFPEFCRRVEAGSDYWNTRNFAVRRDGAIVKNPLGPLVEDIDKLPYIDRQLMYDADPAILGLEEKQFMSTRGCPYRCTYCFNSRYNKLYEGLGSVIRHRTPANLIDEICDVRDRFGLKFVNMADDTFLIKPKGWFEEFSGLYKKRVNVPFSCNVRANVVTEDVMRLLKETGLHMVWMGCECGIEKISNEVLERNITNDQLVRAARIIQKFGIKLATQNLCGLPVPDTYQTDLKTLEINALINPTFAWSSVLYPYPGTPIEKYAREHNYLKGEGISLTTTKSRSMLDFDSAMEKRKIENLHKLFGLLVRFGWLRRRTDFLCRLPLTRFYTFLFYAWYGYQWKFKFYPSSFSVRKLWPYTRLLFRQLFK